jgi:hypothetical protein
MRDRLKNIAAYIFRGWEDEPGYTYPGLKILPPFLFELIAYLIALSMLYQIVAYLWSLI